MRVLVRLALRLLRLASETLFCIELNRLLGRALTGRRSFRVRRIPTAEAALLSHTHADLTTTVVRLPDGLHLHTVIATPPRLSPQQPQSQQPQQPFAALGKNPIVLLHGHSMGGAHFFGNIDDLLGMGFSSVLIPDLPGWARSSRPHFAGTDVDAALSFFLRPLSDWLDAVVVAACDGFALCGHSLGAYLAHEVARDSRHAARVSRLVLAAPAAICRHAPLRDALWFTFTPQRFLTHGGLLAHLLFATRYPRGAAYNVSGFRDYTHSVNSTRNGSGDAAAARMIRFVRRGVQWRPECARPLLECVGRLKCPVHVIAGGRDVLVAVEDVRLLHRALVDAGNDVALVVIEEADHAPHIVTPNAFAKALVARTRRDAVAASCAR